MLDVTVKTAWQKGPDQCYFFTKRWIPHCKQPIAKLIFLHGFMEHINRYDHVFSRYANAGISVFAFDQRGFGKTGARTKTPGQTSWERALQDADFFINKEANSKLCENLRVFLMGHSMGGGLAFSYNSGTTNFKGKELITGGLILSSPLIYQTPGAATWGFLIRLANFVGSILSKLTLKVGVSPKDICRDIVVQEIYAHDPLCNPTATFKLVADMILGGQKLLLHDFEFYPSETPLLAVHGTADNITWFDATLELIEKTNAKDKFFKGFEGFYHEMHNEPGEDKLKEIKFIIDWVLAHV